MTAPADEQRKRVRFEARGAHRELLRCRDTEVAAVGRAGSGKTLAACFKLHLSAMQVPGLRGLMLRATHTSLTATTLVSFQRYVAAAALADGTVRWFGGSGKDPAAFRYSNGSTILVAGGDRPEKFLSADLDRIFVDEGVEISLDLWETLITRLRGKAPTYKQIMLATNPSHPQHWIKRRADEGRLTMITSGHRDNPAYVLPDGTLTPEGRDYLSKLEALTGVRRQRLKEGRWTAAEGVVYEEWDDTVHVVDRFDVPAEWPRIWGVDFGFTNPFTWQCWAIDPDGRLYLYRELYMTRRTVDQHARQMLDLVTVEGDDGVREWTEPRPVAVVCDHDAGDRAVLERELGLATTAAHKAVRPGIQAVKTRLRAAGDGKPRLYVMRDVLVERDEQLAEAKKPLSFVDEVPGYVWAQPKGTVASNKAEPEEPVKVDDHGCDTCRYVVAELDLVGEGRIQSPARRAQQQAPGRGRASSASRYSRPVGGPGGTGGGGRSRR
ncbi:phage terminase large subunit [Streptomyces gancidicus BKS 13-15]|uniref:Phage terminase large subunit n=1 Tax=Streptomyces gancidicus BKS 13-15 TaxID=1284664 RepID=M3CSB4_STREZ|nr:phage terminase large subunit [Streptomyces gancidicus]EMF20400.1 phage terminase large subunit [Streptomyces gancidicus BKS 13-15]